MKKRLLQTFVFLLLCGSAWAQNGEPLSDTSYFQKQGAMFFEVKTSVYADGSEKTIKVPVGDSLALVESTKNRLTSNAAAMAVDVRYVSTYKQRFSALLREAEAVRALTGIDPQKRVQDDFAAAFLAKGWTIERGGGAAGDIGFSVSATKDLKFTVGAAGAKNAVLIGSAIRLKNYPSNGTDTDLFEMPNGVWVDATRTVVLRPPGNTLPAPRAVQAPAKARKG